MSEELKACNRTKSFDSGIQTVYYKCEHKPYVQVEYSGVRNEIINECLCKTHYNALVKNITRIENKTGCQYNLKTELL